MIDISHSAGFVAGLLAGFVHVQMLWKSSQRLSAWTPLLGSLRLGGVAAVLACAAVFGQVLTTTGGWAICFAMSAVFHACAGCKHEQGSAALRSTE